MPKHWPPRTPRSARRRCRSSAPSSSPSPTRGWPSSSTCRWSRWLRSSDNILDQPLIPEPPANTQEMYAILDTVVQTVLTDEDADIAALLAQADADVTALVEGLIGARTRAKSVTGAGGRRVPRPGDGVEAPAARPRRRTRHQHVRDGAADAAGVHVFAWWPIVRAFVLSLQDTNLVDSARCVGLENFRRGARRPAAVDRREEHRCGSCSSPWCSAIPMPLILAVWISELRRNRGLYAGLAYLPVVIPPVASILLWQSVLRRQPDRHVQHDPRLVRPRSVSMVPGPDLGDAVDRAAGHVVGGRGDGDHLPRCADGCEQPSCTRRPRSTARRSGARSGTSRCRNCAPCCS